MTVAARAAPGGTAGAGDDRPRRLARRVRRGIKIREGVGVLELGRYPLHYTL